RRASPRRAGAQIRQFRRARLLRPRPCRACRRSAAMTTPHEINAARDLIARTGETLYNRQLAHGSAGNRSIRLDDGTLLLTPTNSSLGYLDPARLSHLAADGRLLDGDPPSKEAFFHL